MEEKKNPNQTPEISDEELDRVAGGEAFDRVCILCGQGEQVSAGLCQSCLN